MASKSNIEWTDASWNPIVGCSILSPGCIHCYAMSMAARIEAMNIDLPLSQRSARQYEGTTEKVNGKSVWTGKVALAGENILLRPLKRKKPTAYFVNSMSDLFHEDVPDLWIDKVFAVMALAPQHTFQVLTKRAKRMREYMTPTRSDSIANMIGELTREGLGDPLPFRKAYPNGMPWPLPNVWMGVSTERQLEADERIPHLLQTPAAVRFISAEPLLGPIDLTDQCNGHYFFNSLTGKRWHDDPYHINPEQKFAPALDWVIAGAESGPEARPMHLDWARSLRDQCARSDTRFFMKQISGRSGRAIKEMASFPADLQIRSMPHAIPNPI